MLMIMQLALLPNLLRPPLQILRIPRRILAFIRSGNDIRRIRKQVVHFLERQSRRLGQEEIEKDGVGEITDNEEDVVPVFDVGHGGVRDLTNHRVEGEGDHGGDTDALGAGSCVEYLGRDHPR